MAAKKQEKKLEKSGTGHNKKKSLAVVTKKEGSLMKPLSKVSKKGKLSSAGKRRQRKKKMMGALLKSLDGNLPLSEAKIKIKELMAKRKPQKVVSKEELDIKAEKRKLKKQKQKLGRKESAEKTSLNKTEHSKKKKTETGGPKKEMPNKRKHKRSSGSKKNVLYVSRLPNLVTPEEVKQHFVQHGQGPKSVYMVCKKQHKATVKFSSEKGMKQALKLNKSELEGSKITVKMVNNSPESKKSELSVSGLPCSVSAEKLKQHFGSLKEAPESVHLVNPHHSALVEFSTEVDLEEALKMDGSTLGNEQISVKRKNVEGGSNKSSSSGMDVE